MTNLVYIHLPCGMIYRGHQNRMGDTQLTFHRELLRETTSHIPFHILSLVVLLEPCNQEFRQLNKPIKMKY